MIRKYLNNEIDERIFGAEFRELQRKHKTLQDERVNSWPARYDVQLEREYSDGKISEDEFNKKWEELWGYKQGGWHDIVYAELLYLFDRRTDDEEVLQAYRNDADEDRRTYFLTEEQLKEELKRYLKELEACDD